MEQSQMQLIKDQSFINIRESLVNALVEAGILEKRNDIAGWWVHGPQGATWVSVYDVLEEARD